MLDPSRYSPVEVEREIIRYVGLLEKATQETRRRGIASASADADYRVAYARAVVSAEGPVLVRESVAQIECEQLYRAKREAEELLVAVRSAASNLREQLGALRSICANVRHLLEVER